MGLPLLTYFSDNSVIIDNKFYGFDVNKEYIERLKTENYPYQENVAPEFFCDDIEEVFEDNKEKITFTSNWAEVPDCDVYIITVGTPMDEEGNARVDAVEKAIQKINLSHVVRESKKKKLIVLRSTVFPGTTQMISKILVDPERMTLIFCPERIAQGKTFVEYMNPELVGAETEDDYKMFVEFWMQFFPTGKKFFHLTWKEAELGKLMTNMYRYVNFALANEFFLISDRHGCNYEKIRQAVKTDYPRADLPNASPNVSGPCLFKDGEFLVADVPYNELIRTALVINESMVEKIAQYVKDYSDQYEMFGNEKLETIVILGASFKANSDDTRNSLSFKLKKVLKRMGFDVKIIDPEAAGNSKLVDEMWWCERADAYVLMTPHDYFDEKFYNWLKKNVPMIDFWKHFEASKATKNGVYITK